MIENYQKLIKDILGINNDEVNELREKCDTYAAENISMKAKMDSIIVKMDSIIADYKAEQKENKKQYNILFDNLLSEGYTPEQINNLFGKKN